MVIIFLTISIYKCNFFSYLTGEMNFSLSSSLAGGMMELTTLNPEMADVLFRAGRFYTLEELGELARRGLETYEGGISHRRAAEILNERHDPTRGKFHRPQVSAALKDPEGNPGMVLLLVETFTDYTTDQRPRYLIERKG